MPDTRDSRAAIRLAEEYRTNVNGGLSTATLKLQYVAGLLRDLDRPLPWPEHDPVWFEHALDGLETALTNSMALQDAIRAAIETTKRDQVKADAARVKRGSRFLHAHQITPTSTAADPVPEPCVITRVTDSTVWFRNSTGFRSLISRTDFPTVVKEWIKD